MSEAEPSRDALNGAGGGVEAPGDDVSVDAAVHHSDGFIAFAAFEV